MSEQSRHRRVPFEDAFYYGSLNRFVGSGGEILVKPDGYEGDGATRMEVGDRLFGVGATHLVENMSEPPGPRSFHAINDEAPYVAKIALRGLHVTGAVQTEAGIEFSFEPLSPTEFSRLAAEVSSGGIEIAPETIPKGTYVISILQSELVYSLADSEDRAAVWTAAASGERHWNVGVGKDDDFWWARFPTDDVGLLTEIPPYERVGEVRFGLSMLEGSRHIVDLEPVEITNPYGTTSSHDFCLSGTAAGVAGLATAFPIGLRTEILFHPIAKAS